MYNGIGLTTPRGSGTSGYVQKNLSYVGNRTYHQICYERDTTKKSGSIYKKRDKDILEHEKKREIEIKCLELNDMLEEQGYPSEEIESKVDEFRKALYERLQEELIKEEEVIDPQHDEVKNQRLRSALGISENYIEGSAFNFEDQKKLADDERAVRELHDQKRREEIENLEKAVKKREKERQKLKERIQKSQIERLSNETPLKFVNEERKKTRENERENKRENKVENKRSNYQESKTGNDKRKNNYSVDEDRGRDKGRDKESERYREKERESKRYDDQKYSDDREKERTYRSRRSPKSSTPEKRRSNKRRHSSISKSPEPRKTSKREKSPEKRRIRRDSPEKSPRVTKTKRRFTSKSRSRSRSPVRRHRRRS